MGSILDYSYAPTDYGDWSNILAPAIKWGPIMGEPATVAPTFYIPPYIAPTNKRGQIQAVIKLARRPINKSPCIDSNQFPPMSTISHRGINSHPTPSYRKTLAPSYINVTMGVTVAPTFTKAPIIRGRERRAGCIIVGADGQMLCVRNVESGCWGFPKGRIEPGETPSEGAIRELAEETGIKLGANQLGKCYNNCKGAMYLVDRTPEMICTVDGREIDSHDWLTIDELAARKVSQYTRAYLGRMRMDGM